jgi:hypothetical protein
MEEGKNLMWLLILIVVAFNFLDMVVTLVGVSALGIEQEGNPRVVCLLLTNPFNWLKQKILGSMVVLGAGFIVEKANHYKAYLFFNYILAWIIGVFNFLTMTWIFSIMGKI